MTQTDRVIDAALVLKAQLGDGSAFEQLVLRHDALLRYYVRRMLGTTSQVDDVVQEVWLAAVDQVRLIRDGGAFRMWLCRVARNQCVSHIRANTRLKVVPFESVPEPQDVPAGEVELDVDDDVAALNAAIASLPASNCEVVTLRFVEGLSYEEIAAVVGCPAGTVRSRLYYAKAYLLRQLRPEQGK